MPKLTVPAFAIAIGLAFSAGAAAQSLSKAEYNSGKDAIAADYKSASAACASISGNAQDICKAEARGRENVATAELEARFAPGSKNRYAVSVAKAKAVYAVAREKCDDRSGNDKPACVKQAKAAETRAIADAKAKYRSADATGRTKSAAGTASTATVATSKKVEAKDYVEDSLITAKVKAAVFDEPSLKSAEINVETYKGMVQLSGFVRSRADINKAVAVARQVNGVTSVKNDMVVKGQQ